MKNKVTRKFFTLKKFKNVLVKIPKQFSPNFFLPKNTIIKDNKKIIDTQHFYYGFKLPSGEYINRHFYFSDFRNMPLGKNICAQVEFIEERMSDGRKFLKVDIYPYENFHKATTVLKMKNTGPEVVPLS